MNQREASKQNWNSTNTVMDINSGSLQRIADATEKMASSYDNLRNDRDLYKKWYEEGNENRNKLERKISALRGVITKLKKRNP